MATIGWDNTCVAIEVGIKKDFWEADRLSVAMACLFGFIIGAVLCGICAIFCLRDMTKKYVSFFTILFFSYLFKIYIVLKILIWDVRDFVVNKPILKFFICLTILLY
eukprot:GHVR01112933.1.p2 GENE.GHVR01112933.1~~GHVR01112933.1.p2  ORF type:complete len:107 (+),score=4.31 GHVR01112933.1:226-546(+)